MTGVISWGVKRQGRKADRSSPSSSEVQSEWSSTPHYALTALTGTDLTFGQPVCSSQILRLKLRPTCFSFTISIRHFQPIPSLASSP